MIDPILYKDFQSEKPKVVLKRCDATYYVQYSACEIKFWGHDIQVIPASQRVVCPDLVFEGGWAYVPLSSLRRKSVRQPGLGVGKGSASCRLFLGALYVDGPSRGGCSKRPGPMMPVRVSVPMP